jgi:large subunit ribosomal protein L9
VKVVLRDDVANLGQKGDVVDVADGYARNFLVPRGFAIKAESGVVKQAEAMRRNRSARELRDRETAQALADRFTGRTLSVPARAGEGGKLFGSITSSDIVAALQAQFGVELDRRRLALDEPLKELGTVELPVRLHTDVVATLTVDVVAQ